MSPKQKEPQAKPKPKSVPPPIEPEGQEEPLPVPKYDPKLNTVVSMLNTKSAFWIKRTCAPSRIRWERYCVAKVSFRRCSANGGNSVLKVLWPRWLPSGEDPSPIRTPNALRVALETAHEISRRRVIVVFGYAGLRDVQKRMMMGEIAGKLADTIIVTAEDPRTESLDAINAQIVEGLQHAGRRKDEDYFIVNDRAEAIAFAIKMATVGDVVIVCGKGHERSMCFGTTEYPWSDQDAVVLALNKR